MVSQSIGPGREARTPKMKPARLLHRASPELARRAWSQQTFLYASDIRYVRHVYLLGN